MAELFPPPIGALLARAEAACERRGARLTELRRTVLGLILAADRPVGAYDLLDRLRNGRRQAAPPTVYRALDFLLEQGLIHRIERLSAFVGCVSHGDVGAGGGGTGSEGAGDGHAHHHAAQFLICRDCGRVTELDDHGLVYALTAAAARQGFQVGGASTVEAEGTCAACRDASPKPAAAPA